MLRIDGEPHPGWEAISQGSFFLNLYLGPKRIAREWNKSKS